MIPDSVNVALLAISPLVSAVIVPLLTNFLTAKNASGAVKQAVAGALSLIVAVAAVLIANSFDLTNLSATILVVLGAAKAGYEIFSKLIAPLHDAGPQLGASAAPVEISGNITQGELK